MARTVPSRSGRARSRPSSVPAIGRVPPRFVNTPSLPTGSTFPPHAFGQGPRHPPGRVPWDVLADRLGRDFVLPQVLHDGGAFATADALVVLGPTGFHGAYNMPEGAVWRVERRSRVDFLAQFVRPDKIGGRYWPESSGQGPLWNGGPAAIMNIRYAVRFFPASRFPTWHMVDSDESQQTECGLGIPPSTAVYPWDKGLVGPFDNTCSDCPTFDRWNRGYDG